MRTGFTRVHTDKDMGRAMFALQIRAKRTPCSEESGVVQRRCARNAANSVGSKKLFSHGKEPVSPPVLPTRSRPICVDKT